MEIKRKVDSLIKKYETSCPFKLAEALGVHIEFENLGSSLGYYTKAFRIPIIKINEFAPEKQQIFICGHELAHHVLHPDENTSFLKKHTFYSTDRIEIEAHKFALELITANAGYMTKENVEEYGIPPQLALVQSLKNF